ncbi:hypothetical protein [Desulfuromonas thiophila]|uniref:hypothetical protein n=1 Tax=Desulfuromonas thiophila TaxID=57664 RepID=UPI003898DF09
MNYLLQPTGIDGLEKSTFLDTAGWSDMGCGEILLGQNLKQMPPRRMLFKVVVGQNFQLIFKRHLQWPVASGLKNRNLFERSLERGKKLNDRSPVKANTVSAEQKWNFRKTS